jgi:hypothetical protein
MKVTLDDSLRAKLNGLSETVEVCDEAGNTVGVFLTFAEYKRLIYAWARHRYPAEELERRAQERGGRTTSEVLARLQNP